MDPRVVKRKNAILSFLSSIRHLKLWEHLIDRDLISEFSAEKFLTTADIASLYEHFALKRAEAERQAQIRKSKDVVTM